MQNFPGTRFIGIATCLLLSLISCKKEYSYESGLASLKAKGSLKDSSGNCQSIKVSGTYQTGIALTDSNYITVAATITAKGTYSIATDTVNGYWFSDSGIVNGMGTQAFKLKGHGKPELPAAANFTVRFDNTFCSFTIAPNAAVYSFAAPTGSCPDISVWGNYQMGTPLNVTDTVSIPINVTIPGTYAIQTQMANGMFFAAQGIFFNTGNYNVTLAGTGTPAAAGIASIPITLSSSNCSFPVIVVGNRIIDTSMHWQFTVGGITYKGYLDSAFTRFQSVIIGETMIALSLSGATGFTYKPSPDSTFNISVRRLGNTISTGIYNKGGFAAIDSVGEMNFSTPTNDIYYSSVALYPNYPYDPLPGFSIVLSVYDTTTRLVQGSFSGPVYNTAKQPVNVSNGQFKTYLSQK